MAEHPIDLHVRARLRLARAYAGLSQDECATRLGMSLTNWRNYERGTSHFSVAKLADTCRALGVPLAWMVAELPGDADEAMVPPGVAEMFAGDAGRLLRIYHEANRDDRQLLIALAQRLVEPEHNEE